MSRQRNLYETEVLCLDKISGYGKKYIFMQGVNASGTHCSQNAIGQTISGGGIDRGCAVCSFCQLPTQITMQRNRDNKSP